MRKFFLSIALIVLFISTHAQLDSLKKLLSGLPGDTNRVLLLNELIFRYSNVSRDTAEMYVSNANELVRKLDYRRGKALTLYSVGYLKWSNGDIVSGITFSERSIEMADSLGDLSIRSKALRNIGVAYLVLGDQMQAISYFIQSEEGFKRLGNREWMANLLNILGYAYIQAGDLKNAEISLLKSFSLTIKSDFHYNGLLLYIAILRIHQNRLIESDSIISHVFPIIKNLSITRIKAFGYRAAAMHYLAKGEFIYARELAHQALIYYQNSNFVYGIYDSNKLLSDIEFNLGNFEKAYFLLFKSTSLSDSIRSGSAKTRFDLFEMKEKERYKTIVRKDNELMVAKIQNQRNLFWAATLFLILLIIGLIFHVRNKQKTNNKLKELNDALGLGKEELQAINEELVRQQEEVSSQRDAIALQNKKLNIAKSIIEEQNKETSSKNDWLETEVSERTKRILEYNTQLEQYAFITAHNLRSPVARILGLGNLMRLIPDGAIEQKELLNKVLLSIEDLDMIIRDLNRMIEVKQNAESVFTQVIFFDELEKIKNSLSTEIGQSQCEINSDFEAVSALYSIQAYIDSIFYNLISNAIKYRDPSRPLIIKIKTMNEGDFLVLRLEDNGLGIDLKLYGHKIFSIGSRFHDHVVGRGFGLFLVKTQVEALHGKIEVTSEVGVGSVFTIYLSKG